MSTPYTPQLSRDGQCLLMPDGTFKRIDTLPRYQPTPVATAAPAPVAAPAPTPTPTAAPTIAPATTKTTVKE